MSYQLASIIINNFNYGRFLGDAIDSALVQTYPHTEVIIVDDGSTDNSRAVVKQYGDRVKSVFKSNGGQGSAFNAGFSASRGDVVCFLDSDDLLDPSAIENAVGRMKEPGVVKVEWILRIIDEAARQTGQIVPEKNPPEEELRDRIIREGPFYDWLLTPPSSGNAYARSMLEGVLPVPESDYRNGADVFLTVLAPLYGNIRRVQESLGSYRVHGLNNFFGRRLDDSRLDNYIVRFHAACRAVQNHLERQGITVNVNSWRERNFNYLWPSRLLAAKRDLEALIPLRSKYVLVDGGEWGNDEPVRERNAIRIREQHGIYCGAPGDDDEAIHELERTREAGAQYIVFWWTHFWWFEHYQRFTAYLRTNFERVMASDWLVAFDLRNRRKDASICPKPTIAASNKTADQSS